MISTKETEALEREENEREGDGGSKNQDIERSKEKEKKEHTKVQTAENCASWEVRRLRKWDSVGDWSLGPIIHLFPFHGFTDLLHLPVIPK